MDRDEQLRTAVIAVSDNAGAFEPGEVVVSFDDAMNIARAHAALESRPAPTEERAREVLADELFRNNRKAHAEFIQDGGNNGDLQIQLRAMLRFATETQPVAGGEQVELAFMNLCEALGISATPAAYLDAVAARKALQPTTPERAKTIEEIDREMLRSAIGRGLDDGPFNLHSDRITAIEERVIAALSASPPEVVDQ